MDFEVGARSDAVTPEDAGQGALSFKDAIEGRTDESHLPPGHLRWRDYFRRKYQVDHGEAASPFAKPSAESTAIPPAEPNRSAAVPVATHAEPRPAPQATAPEPADPIPADEAPPAVATTETVVAASSDSSPEGETAPQRPAEEAVIYGKSGRRRRTERLAADQILIDSTDGPAAEGTVSERPGSAAVTDATLEPTAPQTDATPEPTAPQTDATPAATAQSAPHEPARNEPSALDGAGAETFAAAPDADEPTDRVANETAGAEPVTSVAATTDSTLADSDRDDPASTPSVAPPAKPRTDLAPTTNGRASAAEPAPVPTAEQEDRSLPPPYSPFRVEEDEEPAAPRPPGVTEAAPAAAPTTPAVTARSVPASEPAAEVGTADLDAATASSEPTAEIATENEPTALDTTPVATNEGDGNEFPASLEDSPPKLGSVPHAGRQIRSALKRDQPPAGPGASVTARILGAGRTDTKSRGSDGTQAHSYLSAIRKRFQARES